MPAMLKLYNKHLRLTIIFLIGVGGLGISEARAASLTWKYTADSNNDGVEGGSVGTGTTPGYEMYGMAYGYDAASNRYYVAVNSNLPLAGISNSSADGGTIAYGDVFLNFTGKNFHAIQSTNKLFAVRFANNGSTSKPLGLYKNVTAASNTSTNVGFDSLEQYKNRVVNAGGNPSLGSLDTKGTTSGTWDYFDNNGTASASILNVIGTGKKVENDGFSSLNTAALQALGLDLSGNGQTLGSEVYGFSFNASALGFSNQSVDLAAHLFAECGNDGMGFVDHIAFGPEPGAEVPEPTAISGLVALGLMLKGYKSKKRA
jgi:hypothetical protein